MAREIRGVSNAGTLYARIMNAAGLWWNGTTFEAYAAGNYGDYDVAMTEQGNSGVYVADFPSAIQTGGTYEYFVHKQAGASPAEADPVVGTGKVDWSGTVAISSATGSMTGSEFRDYLVTECGFMRTDKDSSIYAAITDAVQEMRRLFNFGEAEVESVFTDTISTLGEYKLDLESDMGLLIGIRVEDDENADPLVKVSKETFDQMYPDIAVSSNRGYPRHYCVFGDQVLIGPAPDDTSYVYRQSYSRRAGTVTSSTTGVPFTNLYRDVLADATLARLYKALEEYDKSDRHRAEFARGFEQARSRERRNRGEGSFVMRQQDF